MRVVFLVAVIALGFRGSQDDLDTKVSKLLEQLNDDDIAPRDEAFAELVKLGPSALPILRRRVEREQGELKTRIQQIIGLIERQERLATRLGKLPLVTIDAADRPVAEVIENFRKQSGQQVELRGELSGAKVTVKLEKSPCWAALDAICRAHGHLRLRFTNTGAIVEAGEYRDCPRTVHDRFFLYVERILIEKYDGGGGSLAISPWLVWPSGSAPDDVRITTEELVDDKGTNVLQYNGDSSPTPPESEDEARRMIRTEGWHWSSTAPAEGAEKLAKFKGTVTVRYVLSRRRILTIDKPTEGGEKTGSAGDWSVRIRSCRRTGEDVQGVIAVGAPQGVGKVLSRHLALRDSKGRLYTGYGRESSNTLECAFVVATDSDIVALDLFADEDVEEIRFPFDFSGTRIR